MVEEELISSGEAAEALGFNRRSLSRWAREGRLTPALRSPGGQYRWRLSDLRRQLAELEQGHDADRSSS